MASHLSSTHPCPIGLGGGGLIDASWCLDRFTAVLEAMSEIRSEADVVRGDFLIHEEGPLQIHYCVADRINREASVVIVGITPGRYQMYLAAQEAQRRLRAGASVDEALARASDVSSYGGVMRTNLVNMLDGLGLHERLGISTTDRLFDEHADLVQSTSALLHAVFYRGKNYSGSPEPERFPILRSFVDQVLAAELEAVPHALVVPLGKCVESQLRRLAEGGRIDAERCLFGFPHPSGGNGHRVRLYRENFDRMAAQVAGWTAPGARRG